MGINDFMFTPTPYELVTCSSDRSAKVWQLDLEAKTVTEVRCLELSPADTAEIKENVEKQILGLAFDASTEHMFAVALNSDIHSWSQTENSAVSTLRGHTSNVVKVTNFQNKFLVSGDTNARVLLWDPTTGTASRSATMFQGKISVNSIACNSTQVFVCFGDASIA